MTDTPTGPEGAEPHGAGSQRDEFLVRLTPVRDDMPDDPTEAEAEAVARHFDYMSGLADRAVVTHAGRTLDAPFVGIVLVRAESLEAARALADADPGVRAGVFHARVQPFRTKLGALVSPG